MRFTANDVSACCLRATGVNALLCAGIDTNIIRLLDRWRLDETMQYLHCQARLVLKNFAHRILIGGHSLLSRTNSSLRIKLPTLSPDFGT